MPRINQQQIKISLSPQLKNLVRNRAKQFGIPVTQFVKFLIINDLKNMTNIPIFTPSKRTQKKADSAIKNINESILANDKISRLNYNFRTHKKFLAKPEIK